MENSRVICFGPFEADLRTRELRKRGLKLKLQEQPFRVLAMLVERPGELVTREEIRARLWPQDTFLDFDHGLNAAVRRLREALNDNAATPRFVETLPRRGYRLIAPVEQVRGTDYSPAVSAEAQQPGKTSILPRLGRLYLVGAVLVLLVALLVAFSVGPLHDRIFSKGPPAIHSIAILPLENLSGDPEQDYFAEGMTDELITELSKIGGLRVIARTSSMAYKGIQKPISEIARELNVDAVIEGSVLHSGGQVRINVQLVDTSTRRTLWAQTYDRELGDILALHSDVARAIVRQVRITVTPEERERLARASPVSPRAYEASLRGWYLFNKRTREDMRTGIDYFEQAVKIDPHYAPAYAGIAESYVLLLVYGPLPPAMVYPKAKAAAEKAVALDESMSEAHAALAEILLNFEWDWPAAEKEFRRAIALNPTYAIAHHRYGWFLNYVGRHDEALAEMKRAQELDPLSLIINTSVGSALYYRGDYDLAIKQWHKTLELDPTFPPLRLWLGLGYMAKGLHDDGLRELELAANLYKGNPLALADLVLVYARSGKPAEAHRILATLQKKAREGYVPPYNMAMAYAGIGVKAQAIKYLEKGYQEHDWGMLFLKLERNGWYKSLHSDPRFQAILRRMNFPP